MNNCLHEVHFEEVEVLAKFATEFEHFCDRNNIPFKIHDNNSNKCTYFVRAGIDYTDALIMILKMGWDGSNRNDVDVINTLNTLVMSHNYFQPEYEYELPVGSRNPDDTAILCNFVGL